MTTTYQLHEAYHLKINEDNNSLISYSSCLFVNQTDTNNPNDVNTSTTPPPAPLVQKFHLAALHSLSGHRQDNHYAHTDLATPERYFEHSIFKLIKINAIQDQFIHHLSVYHPRQRTATVHGGSSSCVVYCCGHSNYNAKMRSLRKNNTNYLQL